MTELTAPVSRRTIRPHPRHDRRVIATLVPGDCIALRLERDRREPFLLDLHQLYNQAELKQAAVNNGVDVTPCKNPRR